MLLINFQIHPRVVDQMPKENIKRNPGPAIRPVPADRFKITGELVADESRLLPRPQRVIPRIPKFNDSGLGIADHKAAMITKDRGNVQTISPHDFNPHQLTPGFENVMRTHCLIHGAHHVIGVKVYFAPIRAANASASA